jgi:hypothetical protein
LLNSIFPKSETTENLIEKKDKCSFYFPTIKINCKANKCVWVCEHGIFMNIMKFTLKNPYFCQAPWIMPVILATQEAETRRNAVWSWPGQIVCETLSGKNSSQKRAGGVAQGVGCNFKPQYCKTKQNKTKQNKTKHYLRS